MSRYLIISRAFDVRETRHRAHGFPGCRDRPRGEAILRYLKEVGSPAGFEPATIRFLSVRIAAALVSLNGHVRIRPQPNFVDRSFLNFLPGKVSIFVSFRHPLLLLASSAARPSLSMQTELSHAP